VALHRCITFFHTQGVAEASLAATITIMKVSDGSLVVTDQAMTEIANIPGWYWYPFTTIDVAEDYVVRYDSVTLTTRYAYDTIRMTPFVESDGADNYNMAQIQRILVAEAGNEASGGDTATHIHKSMDGNTDRMQKNSVDEEGNRAASTYDVT